ncbi:MAG: hypothetical protein ACREI2_10230 [Nitrospiraceae bacterium]
MSTQSYFFIDGMLFLLLTAVALLTHATTRHVVGALVVGTAGALLHTGHVVAGQTLGWWSSSSLTLTHGHWLMGVGLAFWLGTWVGLICWRVVTVLGARGLVGILTFTAGCGLLLDSVGSPVSQALVFAPGLIPRISDGVFWATLTVLSQGVMWLIAGTAPSDASEALSSAEDRQQRAA